MGIFMDKYYPSIAKNMSKKNIQNLEKLLELRKTEFKKKYGETA
jgi:hypothetical protein